MSLDGFWQPCYYQYVLAHVRVQYSLCAGPQLAGIDGLVLLTRAISHQLVVPSGRRCLLREDDCQFDIVSHVEL